MMTRTILLWPGRGIKQSWFDSPSRIRYIRNVIVGFFRLIIYAVVAYLIYKFVQFVFAPPAKSGTARRAEGRSGVMVKDEVCNTYLPKEDAIKETVGGREYYFCSQECRQKFDEQRKRSA
jgi:uncharacterized protein